MTQSTWEVALGARGDLTRYGDISIGLFALALRFAVEDIQSVAAESVTDGGDDKKCDIIYIDRESGVAVVAQCYMSKKGRISAPANKASELNTAVAWLLQRAVKELPVRLRSSANELRSALASGEIKRFEAWFVHNLPESKNVGDELVTVAQTARNLIQTILGPKGKIELSALEIGKGRLEELYRDTLSPILVDEEEDIEIESGFSISAGKWKSYVTAIQARALHKLYKSHGTRLFSANVRDYLGSRNSDANINNGIKQTAKEHPENFWVFNNGITILTHSFDERLKGKKKALRIRGISIVNGAQTTGAIGTLPKAPAESVYVPARFVSTSDSELVYEIIQFNNSQNKVTASDFRSTDRVQKRLRSEVDAIAEAKYEGGRRGGTRDAIERNKNLMPSYTVGQALAAFHQEPIVAYNQKSEIWNSDHFYSRFFNESTTGLHLVFCFSLLRAVEDAKRALVSKSKQAIEMTSQESALLDYFRQRGSIYLFMSALASCLETFSGRRIGQASRVSFGPKVSPRLGIQYWTEVLTVVSPFCEQLSDALSDGLKSNERVQKAIATFRSLVQATATANSEVYRRFAKHVVSS